MGAKRAIRDFFLPRLDRRYAARVIAVAAAAWLFFGYALIPIKLRGKSMEPTLGDGSFHLVWGLSYLFSGPERGDIVGIRLAGRKVILLKRVVALEGEEVSFVDGALLVDGRRIEEPYAPQGSDWNYPPRRVSPGKVFVVGDNRLVPAEAHDFGEVSRSRVIGRMVW